MSNQLSILKDLKNQLDEKDSELIKELILFGSQANGNVSKDSDFDILILVNKKPSLKEKNAISNVCYDINLKYDILIDSRILLAFGLLYDFETSKHQQLIGWLNKNFIKEGLIDKEYGKIVHNAYEN